MSEQYTVPKQGEFFERLGERAWLKLRKGKDLGKYNEAIEKLAIGPANGVNATIEALKEMMVGEPMIATISHNKLIMGDIGDEEYLFTNLHVAGHHGTDGEEVTVMVLRDAS